MVSDGIRRARHGVLALEIAEHAMNETLEHTGLGGKIRRTPNRAAHGQARRLHKAVRDMRGQAGRFLRTHASEALETALEALQIAAVSIGEVAERYE